MIVPRDRASLSCDRVSVLFPSEFTIVRFDPVKVVVIDPAGFVTVCVFVVVPSGDVTVDLVLVALGVLIGCVEPPEPLLRSAARGIQTSMPIAAIVRICLRIADLLQVDLARE